MSMITRCPACQTQFKVVPDQLRISDGWVRCGQCRQVFDATPRPLPSVQEIVPESEPTAGQAVPADQEAVPGLVAEPAQENSWQTVTDLPDGESVELPLDKSALLASTTEPDFISFLRNGKTGSSSWHKPLVRLSLFLLCAALGLGLLVQIIVHERDSIVATRPALRPWLLSLCGPLNCSLSPLRRIESLVIESAKFNKLQGDSYRLNFTIKNTAAVALAVPAVELTITDTLDQPILRRIFMPPEIGFKGVALAAGAEWPASLVMTINVQAISERVVGYRVLAFYP